MNINRIIIATLAFTGCILLLLTIFYIIKQKEPSNVNVNEGASTIKKLPTSLTSNTDISYLNEYVKTADMLLAGEKLSIQERSSLLLKKGFAMISTRSSSDITSSIRITTQVFQEVLLLTENDKYSQYGYLREQAYFGYFYNFAMNCFSGGVTVFLPKYLPDGTHTYSYFKDIPRTDYKRIQQGVFRAMLNVSSSSFNMYANDKTLVGARLFVASTYLSSFHSDMPKEESDRIKELIKKDLSAYPLSKKLIFTDEKRADFRSSLHQAIAFDTYNSIGSINKKMDSIINKQIDSNYLNLRENLKEAYVKDTDKISLAFSGMLNETYYLSSAYRRYGDSFVGTKEANNSVKLLSEYIYSFPEVTDVTKGFYNFGLTPSGQWYDMKHYLFAFTLKDNELFNVMKNIGVDVEKFKPL